MGFKDKLKNIFKKKEKADEPAAPKAKPAEAAPAAAPAAPAVEFKSQGQVGDALKFAADKVQQRLEAGQLSEIRANILIGGLKDIDASDAPDDAKLISISQTLGGAFRV
ncbi:MAG: hypothetical protein J6Y18_01385 [Candidatus Methanomethylophilaceae archaeon]|nr:hypothetical protein [Candidatus Methanomethylophilaceae archaeon]MBP5394548.1 hypothetical protein [Candidatus Methanomethylophilaceae archaeon]